VWDKHWCGPASERLDKLVPRMDEVVRACRAAGIQVIHAPSETLSFYQDTVPRRRMQEAPRVDPPKPMICIDPKLPIDDSDGGCTDNSLDYYNAWTREHAGLSIEDADGISDNGGEVYSYLAANGITNLLVMGVHTNMCILGRPFAIRQMTKWGIHCHLIRDLTDTMYDPQDAPHVSHDEGTELVVEHIEKYWAPSCTSADLLAALPK
jgi:nicotinamidase-related amidase